MGGTSGKPMSRATGPLAGLAVVVALGCASAPPSVPVEGEAADLGALAGEWEGTYESGAAGRRGSIRLTLVAGEDHAHGDVLMIPAGSTRPYLPSERSSGTAGLRTLPQVLTIRFVRASGKAVSGTLDSYWDPDCECEAVTTFVGEIKGDAIEGTFTTSSARTAGLPSGRWKVARQKP